MLGRSDERVLERVAGEETPVDDLGGRFVANGCEGRHSKIIHFR